MYEWQTKKYANKVGNSEGKYIHTLECNCSVKTMQG